MAANSAAEKDRRAAFAFISSSAEKWIWVPDPVQAFLPSKVVKEFPNGDTEVELASSAIKLVKKADLGPLILRVSDLKNSFEDMVRMGDVNEATILHNLRMRYLEDLIYTNIGSILVAINPFKAIKGLYSKELVFEYFNVAVGEVSQPHVFQIAASAYFGLRSERHDQAIIISGESGAGKTEATKQCLKFFAEAAGSSSAGMAEKLLSANPILEAFGNAKTVRNNNSSRFGKWMEVHFNARAQICGSQIINYLLEKSRVAFQATNERNYHIFYMLPLAATPAQRKRFSLEGPEAYVYSSKNGITRVEGLDDEGEYHELLHSFGLLEISETEFDPMLQIVAGILHLSNVVFDAVDADTAKMSNSPAVISALENAANLLQVDEAALRNSMEQKLIETRNERVRSPLSAEKAGEARNSMAKAIYGRMFDWLVMRVNQAMEGNLKSSSNIIGVLDIFGFEIFEINSFEQLCINYCNEKLQQHFNYHIFKQEEKCYQAEEIDYAEIKFVDNQDVLDLIEKKPEGLLPKLDDECKVPRGSDSGYLEKIQKSFEHNVRFKGRVRRGPDNKGENEFGVNHYAGTVYYDIRGFSEKNKDELMLQVKELLQSSRLPFITYLFSDEARDATLAARAAASEGRHNGNAPAAAKQQRGGADKETQSTQFRGQLDALMKTLNTTAPHFIRCIKPNSVKKGNIFDAPVCLQQLRYAGVFEAVRVRQLGFPFRYVYEVFYKRYRCIAQHPEFRKNIPASGFPYKDRCRAVLEDVSALAPNELQPVQKLFKFGKTMVLYRADQHRVLEMVRDHVRDAGARKCERVWRGYVKRKYAKRIAAIRTQCRQAIKARDLALVNAALAAGNAESFKLFILKELVELEKRLLEEKACRELLVKIYPLDPADHYSTYENTLKDAKKLNLVEEDVYKTAAVKFGTVKDRIEAKQGLTKGIAEGNKALILRSLAKVEELRKDWGEIVPREQIESAQAMLAIIALEVQVQDSLKAALASGGPRGAIGELDVSTIDVSALEVAIAAATNGRVSIKTAYGANLITTCAAIRELRLALKSGVWRAIEMAVAAAVKLKTEDRLTEDGVDEVRMAEAELADRKIQVELVKVLSQGAPKGEVGELDPKSADVVDLSAAIKRTRDSAEAVGGLSLPAQNLLTSAELILRLRMGLVHQPLPDWTSVKKAVLDGLNAKLSEACAAEVKRAKAELDNHSIIHHLHDALDKGAVGGYVSHLDISVIDTTLLSSSIKHAEDLVPQTQTAQVLLNLARIIRRLRETLREKKPIEDLLAIVNDTSHLPQALIPERSKMELILIKYEAENVTLVKALRAAISQGAATGYVGNVDKNSVSIVALEDAVKLCDQLVARSPEALWLLALAEALIAMRKGFKMSAWADLEDLIIGVKCLHGTTRHPQKLGLQESHAASSSSTAGRKRGSSGDKRPTGLAKSASINTGSLAASVSMSLNSYVSDKHHNTLQDKSLGLKKLNLGKEAEDELNKVFDLPAHVQEEISLLQDELNNTLTISQLMKTLSSGGPVGELGVINASACEIDHLSIALKRAQRIGIKTPIAAALFYTGQVIRDLRHSLRENEWNQVEATLRSVALNNARIAKQLGHTLPPGLSHTYLSTTAPGFRSRTHSSSELSHLGSPRAAADESTGDRTPGTPVSAPLLPTSAMPPVELKTSSRDAGALEIASSTLVMPGLAEVIRIEAEAQYRRVMEQMVSALDKGQATGAVGRIDTRSLDVSGLAAAIDASRSLGSRTKQSRHLTALCRLMWQMRTAVGEADWASVESLLVAGAQVLGKVPGQAADEIAMVPKTVREETELYRNEAFNSRLIDTFKQALTTQQATGEIGHLSLSDVGVRLLEDGIRLGLQLGTRTPEAKCMLTTAIQVRALRLSLLAGNWTKLGEYLDYLFTAEAKTKPYTRYGAGAAVIPSTPGSPSPVLSDPLLGMPLPGAVSSSSQAASLSVSAARRAFATVNTKDGLGVMATWPGVVELKDGYDLAIDGVASESIQEANILQLELNNRNVIIELTKACSEGSAQGEIGHLDISTIKTGELDWAIDFAQRVGSITVEAEQLLFTAQTIKKIRMVLSTGDWTALEEAITAAQGSLISEVGVKELTAAQDELNNRIILSELTSGMAKGRVQGRVGRIATGAIDLKCIDDAIALAQKIGPKTQDAKQMLFTAKVVARLRSCLLKEDIAEAGLTLEAVRGKLLASVAFPEIRHVQDEVDNWSVLTDLSNAIAKGGPEGGVGRLDLSKLNVAHLEAALNRADELGIKTTEASNVYTAAAVAFKLRSALLADNWSGEAGSKGVEAVLREFEGTPMSDAVGPELDLLRGELNNRRIVLSLAEALSKGGAKGAVGSIDISEVDTTELDVAIARASEPQNGATKEAERLLQAAKMIRRLRSTLLAGNWRWVGSVLLEARQLKHVFPPVSLKELQQAQDELDNKAIIAQLQTALREGATTGAVGHLDANSADITALDEAIAYARTLGVKSVEASQAVATARTIRALRVAVKANDWADAKTVLDGAQDKNIPSFAAEELQLVRLCVENWQTVRDLQIAVSSGGPVGGLGDADLRVIRTDELNAAIENVMRVGCHTSEARHALVTSLIVMRLRTAFLSQDYALMATVLEEAATQERQGPPGGVILPQAKNEIAYAKSTLEFKKAVELLQRAGESQDENELVSALTEAQRLNLGEHPRAHIKQLVESATMSLQRIQKCKTQLATAIRGKDSGALVEALTLAASMALSHPLVEEARKVQAKVQGIEGRSNVALRAMDAAAMAQVLRDCDTMAVSTPIALEIKRVLELPRNDFLRRELDLVLASVAAVARNGPSSSSSFDTDVVTGGGSERGPTALELRVINCTIQIKDIFFADAPDNDEIIATSIGATMSAALSASSSSLSSSSSSKPSSPAKVQLQALLDSNPAAATAVAALRARRNTEDNIRGDQNRLTLDQVNAPRIGNPVFLFTRAPASSINFPTFKPAGFLRGLPADTPASLTPGCASPPLHSSLRRQLSLERLPKVKPPHMFSSKFAATVTVAESGLLRWQLEPIHTSITLLQEADARHAAVRCFRNILAFMGDRPLSRPIPLGQEVLALGNALPELRDEIFLQLCKQLTGNPSIASCERGYVLLYLCFCTFHPSEEAENAIEMWLREHGAVPCVWALHLTQYRSGPGALGVPTSQEIMTALERARAPMLPSFVLDSESAGGIAEYATVSAPFTSGAAAAPTPMSNKAPQSVSPPQAQGSSAQSSGWNTSFAMNEDHAMQVALLQSMASKARGTAQALSFAGTPQGGSSPQNLFNTTMMTVAKPPSSSLLSMDAKPVAKESAMAAYTSMPPSTPVLARALAAAASSNSSASSSASAYLSSSSSSSNPSAAASYGLLSAVLASTSKDSSNNNNNAAPPSAASRSKTPTRPNYNNADGQYESRTMSELSAASAALAGLARDTTVSGYAKKSAVASGAPPMSIGGSMLDADLEAKLNQITQQLEQETK
jgi:hypothetical protein